VGAAEIRRDGHVVHDDCCDNTTARKDAKPQPAERSIALALDVKAGVLQQQMRVKIPLENAVGHNGSGREEHVVQSLVSVVEYFLAAETVAQAEQPHAKGKREALVEEVQDQH